MSGFNNSPRQNARVRALIAQPRFLRAIPSLVLLTTGTMVLELSVARENARRAQSLSGTSSFGVPARLRTVLLVH